MPNERPPAIAAVEVPETALPTMEEMLNLVVNARDEARREANGSLCGESATARMDDLLTAIQQLHSQASEGK